jgi:hypothetical protein
MCRAAGSGADPKKREVPMKGNVIGPGDEKKYERITFYPSNRKIKV